MNDRDRRAQEHSQHLQLEQHADVVTLIAEAKVDIETHLDLKLDSLKWRMTATLLGGQVLAGLTAAIVTRTTPAEAGRVALVLLSTLY